MRLKKERKRERVNRIPVAVGDILVRNQTKGPDRTDPIFDFIQGIEFKVVKVNPGINVDVEITKPSGDYGNVGDRKGIPEKYLLDTYFLVKKKK